MATCRRRQPGGKFTADRVKSSALWSPSDEGVSWQLGTQWDPYAGVPQAVRRFRQVMTVALIVIIALISIVDFPPVTRSVWNQQWWRFVVFVALVAGQTAYRMRTGNVRRRTTSTVVEGGVVIALFWLSPWLIVAGRLLGALTGWIVAGFLGRRQRMFYLAFHAIEILIVVQIDYTIHPTNAIQGWRPLAVAGVVWAGSVIGRIVTVAAASWIRNRRVRSDEHRMNRSAAFVSAAATVFGLMGAMVIDLVWLGLFPTVALAMLLTRAGNSVRRVNTMERALDELVWLSARTNNASPEHIESDLISAIRRIRDCPTCAVARPAADSGALEWIGPVTASLDRSVDDFDDLRSLGEASAERFARRADGVGSVGVWSVDARRGSALVIESSRRPGQLRGLQDSIETLVASARLGIINAHQLSDLQAEADRERIQARTDAETGLPNAFAATTAVDQRMAEFPDSPVAVIVLSIDGLGEIVDVLGQDAGVAIARSFATRLVRRAPGFVGRVATNNFIAIVDGGAEQALSHVARLTEVAKTAVGDEVITYQVSAGVAVCRPDQKIPADELFRRADLALHDSRRRGEIGVFGDAEAEHEARRAGIRLRLADAIADGKIRPAFQPQIDLATGRMAGMEVLARWNDDELGFVSPGEFIEIAEQSRQVEALTVSMLTQALDAATAWVDFGVAVPISVNLSAQSLMWPRFLEHLIDIVTGYDFGPELLTAEITESTLVAGPAVMEAIGRLRDLGARISIDDFGTGYSALSYMNTLPIHELKIDRSMVETIGDTERPSPVVNRLIDLCADLNYLVVAEGIETVEQATALAQRGCHIGQGYYFARPMMEAEMTEWIEQDHQFDIALTPSPG